MVQPDTGDGDAWAQARAHLRGQRHHWLISGVAGFIGSHLLETLLGLGQRVTGIDNFLTGRRCNLEQVRRAVGEARWFDFTFIDGDIRSPESCQEACRGVDFVLHQAALGSVARSIDDPLTTNDINIGGFLHLIDAARRAKVQRFVYASSSAVYGDHAALPKVEDAIGQPLSPYALSKHVDELYANVFARCYGLDSIGLRYFNVFGPRQDPAGDYAAVIARWAGAMLDNRPLQIHGDGATSRDFCYVDNAVQANLLAALTPDPAALNQVYNVAVNGRTSLHDLFDAMRELLQTQHPHLRHYRPVYGPFRAGDIRHSQADIAKATALLGYAPAWNLQRGLQATLAWYAQQHAEQAKPARAFIA